MNIPESISEQRTILDEILTQSMCLGDLNTCTLVTMAYATGESYHSVRDRYSRISGVVLPVNIFNLPWSFVHETTRTLFDSFYPENGYRMVYKRWEPLSPILPSIRHGLCIVKKRELTIGDEVELRHMSPVFDEWVLDPWIGLQPTPLESILNNEVMVNGLTLHPTLTLPLPFGVGT